MRNPVPRLLFLIISLFSLELSAQEKYTLSGYVRDETNGEELLGVTVYNDSLRIGTSTNLYGFYSITLPPGSYTFSFQYIGYADQFVTVQLDENLSMNIKLAEEALQMQEVVITDRAVDANVTDIRISSNELNIEQVKSLPALFGEPDIIKTIQMLPGVISAGEGTSSFFVRGGSADQNLILIDEAPIYDPSHLFGLFSVFNADVIKDSELYKGGIPSRYGGRLSSILDVRTKDGNNQGFGGAAGIGSIASRLMVEGPIVKDKGSFIFSGRRSYVDLFLKAAGEENTVSFYDVNAKLNWRANNKNRFFAAFYAGRDLFNFDDIFGFNWGNRTATFRWNHLFNDRLFSNTTLIASNFDYALGLSDPTQAFDWTSDIVEYTFKQDMSYFVDPQNFIEFGLQSTYRNFAPGTIEIDDPESSFREFRQDNIFALDNAIYFDVQHNIGSRLLIKWGSRLSYFVNIGEATVFTYEDPQENVNIVRTGTLEFDKWEPIEDFLNLEPRFSMRYMLTDKSSIKVAYNRMVQNTHLIASGTVPLPFNTWQPSGYYLDPQKSDLIAGGYFRNAFDNQLEMSAEAYYKIMNNVTDFADNATLFFNEDLPVEFRQGTSWSYGLELMVQKQKGDFTGFVSYTWSKTMREVPGINFDDPFPANYDRRHSFNFVSTYELNKKWTFGMNFNYGSGRPVTIPAGRYEIEGNYSANLYTRRNGYRLPAYHRMDLSATFRPGVDREKRIQGQWSFSIYNVYNRKNPFSIFTQVIEDDEGNPNPEGNKEARMIYIFPILPSITYNLTF